MRPDALDVCNFYSSSIANAIYCAGIIESKRENEDQSIADFFFASKLNVSQFFVLNVSEILFSLQ